jgi:hypothetical protein
MRFIRRVSAIFPLSSAHRAHDFPPVFRVAMVGFLTLCFSLCAGHLAWSQAATSLRGTVKDPSGAVVPGATVTVTDNANGTVFTATSSGAGYYQFAQIPPSKYTILVTASGFGAQSKVAELLVNQPATIDFALTVSATAVTVDVSGSAQTLNTSDATIGNSVNNEMIQALPMDGRDPISLLSLQPGVLYIGTSTDTRNGSVSGGRSDQGNVTLDGVDDNDQVNGYAFSGVLRSTLDSTEEFRVTTADANADQGRSSGAQVSLITKSGTNKFHGSTYEYYRGSFAHANDWYVKQAQLASGEANKPVKYVQNVFGASFGGPIKRDKLFFFFNFEGYRNAVNESVSRTFPTATFKAGQLGYTDVSGNTDFISPAQVAILDAGCTQCTTPGVNSAVQAWYANVPAANGGALGDGGINSGSYTFSSPNPNTLNTTIFKLDYELNSKMHIFARGNLQKDTNASAEQFPGQGPSNLHEDNTKGMAFGHTWSLTPNIVNDIRYGYVRQGYSDRGPAKGDYVEFRDLDQPVSLNRSTLTNVPLNTISDNFSWSKGAHTIQVGGNWRRIAANTGSDSGSYSYASTSWTWSGGSPPQPDAVLGLPAVNSGFTTSYSSAYSNLVGNVPELGIVSNYRVSSPTAATILPDGAFINRSFLTNEFEYYIQDQWRVQPNLTVTFGIRHSLLGTPYETKGQQIAPTIDTDAWYKERGTAAAQGSIFEQDLEFQPSGKANGRPGFWPRQKLNIAPRFAVVYSPDNKTTVRMGAGMYYDHYGQSIAQRFSQHGSFGLSSTVVNPADVYGFENTPRFTGPHDLPNIDVGPPPATSQSYPYAPADGSFLITWGVDNKLKTPYSEAFDFSLQRELPGGFTLETAYLGRLGRHLLQQIDLAEPVNYVDPAGGGDYFSNGSLLSKISDQNGGNNCVSVPTIPYFEDVFGYMKGFNPAVEADGVTPNPCPTPNATATQAVYTYEWAPNRYGLGETGAIADLDFFCGNGEFNVGYNCPAQSRFWQSQFSSLYAWDSIGMSYYNALQVILRHPSSHGLSADFNYTFSKSIDMGSDVERASFNASGGGFGPIQNTWNPSLNRGVSDFDTKHLITVDWAYAVPVGRGRQYLANSNHLVDALIGGWQFAGLGRWSSGIPFSVYEPGWGTNWELSGWGVNTAKVKLRKHLTTGANPVEQAFDDPAGINNGVYNGNPIRYPYPGEAGTRNPFRGDGYFDIDSSLSKTWSVQEWAKIKLAWEVYNVTNTPRFDTYSIGTSMSYGSLGNYSSTLTTYRRMQFGLRVDF